MLPALQQPTLVLNRQWTPVHVTSVRHAITLVFTGRANVVCPVLYSPHNFQSWVQRGILDGQPIQGVSFTMESPEIIVLGEYAKLPPRNIAFSRRNLMRRDDHTCQYCGIRLSPDRSTIDHVTPASRGGETDWTNCVLSCHRCNGSKADRTPREANMRLLRQPYRPMWSPHYAVFTRKERPSSWDSFLTEKQLQLAGTAE